MLVKMEHVAKQYGGFELCCSLRLAEGYITGLVGPNGSGKTTAFKAILGLISLEGGQIQVFGKDLAHVACKDKAQIGVVLADSGLGGHMTVSEAASFMSAAYDRFDREMFLQNCRKHNLPLNKKIRKFSTGMRTKLKVFIALSHNARLLILDEPTAGLDVMARNELLDMLREYMEQEGRGILISSHISNDLEGLCDDIYMIKDGKIVFHEDTDVILSDYGLLKVDSKQYDSMDRGHILCVRKEAYGFSCLTDNRQFYQQNYPDLALEKGGIDQVELMMMGGEVR